MSMKQRKKKCPACGEMFMPFNSLQKCCPKVACALAVGKKMQRKAFDKETKKRREKLKSKADYMKEAQVIFNRYIRLRDMHQPCISCQRHHKGQYHAGHYRTTKAAPQHRFNPLNVFKQCQPCNAYLSGNITEYRINLIKRIGEDRVQEIENANQLKPYTIDELKRIKKLYAKKYRLYAMKFRCVL